MEDMKKIELSVFVIASVVGAMMGTVIGSLIRLVPEIEGASRAIQRMAPPEHTSDDDDEELIVKTRNHASPPQFMTKIDFSLFSDLRIRKYEAGEFEAGGHRWKLAIYPNGHPSKRSNHVSVYLALADTSSLREDQQLKAIFTVFLYNQTSDNFLCFRGKTRCFTKTKSEWGFPIKSLNNKSSAYIVDGYLVFGAEVLVL